MNKLKKEIYTLLVGFITFVIGILLRLNARGMAWPQDYTYSGDRENTVWAFRELALIDISRALLVLGLAVILLVIAKFLFNKDSEEKC